MAEKNELSRNKRNEGIKEKLIVVVGENPGSKLQKAEKFSVEIINEKEFLNLLKK